MDSLKAINPVDGRYRKKVEELSEIYSEYGYQKYRLMVEIKYLLYFSEKTIFDVKMEDFDKLENIYKTFSIEDANMVKSFEAVTNHDVKAIEYFLKHKVKELGIEFNYEFIHFGLTSQDINSVANTLRLVDSLKYIIVPNIIQLSDLLKVMSNKYINIPMLSRTHGQPASPTLLGKELLVFCERLSNEITYLKKIDPSTKFGGAIGNLNAHYFCDDTIDWIGHCDDFLEILGLGRHKFTTQIDHYDNFSVIFDNLSRISVILIDLCTDIWQYISYSYFSQKIKKYEVGSSTMPHKVNPIDFENAEGNFYIASNYFQFLSRKLPISRLQRDLTDSTITRNIGTPLSHMLIGIKSCINGLNKLEINKNNLDVINNDLNENSIVVSEGIQTLLRYLGIPNGYEKLKEITRNNNNKLDIGKIVELLSELNLDKEMEAKILNITPNNYVGKVSNYNNL